MKQSEVAGLFNVTHSTVGNWENGHAEPKFCHTPTLIKFLGYDPVPPNPKSIAELLLAKRRELGWSQRVAARNLGVDPCTWSSWESGRTIIIHKHRRLIVSFIGICGIIEAIIYGSMNEQYSK